MLRYRDFETCFELLKKSSPSLTCLQNIHLYQKKFLVDLFCHCVRIGGSTVMATFYSSNYCRSSRHNFSLGRKQLFKSKSICDQRYQWELSSLIVHRSSVQEQIPLLLKTRARYKIVHCQDGFTIIHSPWLILTSMVISTAH